MWSGASRRQRIQGSETFKSFGPPEEQAARYPSRSSLQPRDPLHGSQLDPCAAGVSSEQPEEASCAKSPE